MLRILVLPKLRNLYQIDTVILILIIRILMSAKISIGNNNIISIGFDINLILFNDTSLVFSVDMENYVSKNLLEPTHILNYFILIYVHLVFSIFALKSRLLSSSLLIYYKFLSVLLHLFVYMFGFMLFN